MRSNLIAARKGAGLTQKKIAEAIGIKVRHYQRLEHGTSRGSITVWVKLKELLHTPISTLLEETAS